MIQLARKEVVQYFDDLDNTPLDENTMKVIRFSVNGNHYTLDLSPEHAEEFHKVLEPYIEKATPVRVGSNGSNRRRSGAARGSKAREIRKWAQEQGKNVAGRGKIPSEIIEAYNAAH